MSGQLAARPQTDFDIDHAAAPSAHVPRQPRGRRVPRGLLGLLLPSPVLAGVELGARVGWIPSNSLAWMFMVAAELIAASQGLGYLLSDGRETSRADIVLAATVLLATLGRVSDSLMAIIERRGLAWRDSFSSTGGA